MALSRKLVATPLILLMIIFSLLFAIGSFGYGVDYYSLHHKVNNVESRIDFLSVLIISFEYLGFRVGLFLHAFVSLLSLAKLYSLYIKDRLLFFYLPLSIVSWPMMFNISNTMRQGMLVCLIHYIFYLLFKKNAYISDVKLVLLSLPMVLIHRSGVIFSAIIILAVLTKRVRLLKPSPFLMMSVIVITFGCIMYSLDYYEGNPSKIIGINLNYIFLLLSAAIFLGLVFKSFFRKVKTFEILDYFFLYFVSITWVFYMFGMRWEFDRLYMIVFFPILIYTAQLFTFKVKQTLPLLIITLFICSLYLGHIDSVVFKNISEIPD